MTNLEYVAIARRVMDYCQFGYILPRGLAIARCTGYLRKVCNDRPYITEKHKRSHLPIVAKHYYITQINALHQSRQTAQVR